MFTDYGLPENRLPEKEEKKKKKEGIRILLWFLTNGVPAVG